MLDNLYKYYEQGLQSITEYWNYFFPELDHFEIPYSSYFDFDRDNKKITYTIKYSDEIPIAVMRKETKKLLKKCPDFWDTYKTNEQGYVSFWMRVNWNNSEEEWQYHLVSMDPEYLEYYLLDLLDEVENIDYEIVGTDHEWNKNNVVYEDMEYFVNEFTYAYFCFGFGFPDKTKNYIFTIC